MNNERIVAWTLELQNVHHELEAQLRRARAELSHLTPSGQPAPRTLLVHCLGFCTALQAHHEHEDDQLFPRLLDIEPSLHEIVAELMADHAQLAVLLREFDEILDQIGASATEDERHRADRKLDDLHQLISAHFGSEELKLDKALGELRTPLPARRELLGL